MDYDYNHLMVNETQTTWAFAIRSQKTVFNKNQDAKITKLKPWILPIPQSVGSIQKFVPRLSLRPKLEEVSTDGRKECCRKRGTFWAAFAPVFSNHVLHHMAGGSIIPVSPFDSRFSGTFLGSCLKLGEVGEFLTTWVLWNYVPRNLLECHHFSEIFQ
jgi:hypothetical protein